MTRFSSPLVIAPLEPERRTAPKLFRMTADRKAAPRVKIIVGGRIMREDRNEYAATAVEASARSMLLECEVAPHLNERIIGYFFTIGRIEGTVAQLTEQGFILDIASTALKRDRLASQLTWLANRDMLNLPEDRRHDRVVPRDPRITVRQLSNPAGSELVGILIDVSRGGAAASVKGGTFRKGEEILLGSTPARVVRAFEGGIAVEFYGQVPETMFSENIKL